MVCSLRTLKQQYPFAHWPADRVEEMRAGYDNDQVGSILVSETDAVRIWHIHLPAGERMPFHIHRNSYFWTALTRGISRSYYGNGDIRESHYEAGDTKHFTFKDGEMMLHNLENIGDTELVFVTVEFK